MYGYIYETTNLVNGKKYIGQRKAGRPEPYLGSGTLLMRSIKKYGLENFSKRILIECESKEELDRMEIHYIDEANAVESNEYYNIVSGGGTVTGLKHSEETRKKMSVAGKGHKHSDETRRKMSKSQKGRAVSDETKRKISNSRKGMILSDETKRKISEAGRNRPTISEETRRKLSEARRNRPTISEETRRKLSEAAHRSRKHVR